MAFADFLWLTISHTKYFLTSTFITGDSTKIPLLALTLALPLPHRHTHTHTHSPLGGFGLGGTLFFGGRAGVSFFLVNGSSTNPDWKWYS